MPAKMVRMYTSAMSMMSAGVLVSTRMGRVRATVATVSTAPNSRDSQTELAV